MSRQLLITLGAAVIVIGAALYTTVSVNQKHLLTLEGSITDVRVEKLNNDVSSLVLINFTATNPSEVPFDIKQVNVERTANTDAVKGDVLSKAETARYVEYANLRFTNPPLGAGSVVKAKQTAKGLVAARFDIPVSTRNWFRITFVDYNGVTATIQGTPPPTE